MARMTPPSRCWMILFWPVATNTPDATTAPAMGAEWPQTPKPVTVTAMTRMPAIVGSQVRRGSDAYQDVSDDVSRPFLLIGVFRSSSAVQDGRSVGRSVRLAAGDQWNDLVARAERLNGAAGEDHDLVDAPEQRGTLGDRD